MLKWQAELRCSSRSLDDLLKIVPLNEAEQEQMAKILERSPMLITPYYLSLINFEDEDDPIRKMAIPSVLEADKAGSLDTSGELSNTVIVGLQHKYVETVLLLATNACATYCRHCFRKRLVGLEDEDSIRDFTAVRSYIMRHTEVTNVLVSGGDALLNSNKQLDCLLAMLVDIPHLDFIRIATRVPVTLPYRITDDPELLNILAKHNKKKKLYIVTQFNHANEITDQSTAAIEALLGLGIPVRNQAVLLQGINDQSFTLGTLLRKLTSIGVEPYYLFQCRPVSGVKSQFQVPLKEGYKIAEQAKAMQNGFGKAFRYCMSTVAGKIEIMSVLEDGRMLFKYHEAKNPDNLGKVFARNIEDDQAWLNLV